MCDFALTEKFPNVNSVQFSQFLQELQCSYSILPQVRMAKDPKTVSKFLSGLSTKLQPIWVKEKEEMLELKKKDVSIG